ncbi:hypothetical protein GGF46_002604 [Coemansia sp. RSA 552]|nr:hypothetical protein GGF46_002604 [Coemansia sp. RSA 552]
MPAVEISASRIVFDLDGTLIDTHTVTEAVYRDHSQRHGVDAQQVIDFCHGVPTLQVLQRLFPSSTHTREYADQMELESATRLSEIHTIPGTRALLESLPRGSWGIFTSGTRPLALPRLRHLELPVPDVFVTPTDIANGKPHPEGYELAARKLGADPKACVVFEDAEAGVSAGQRSGAVVVGIRTMRSAEQLKAAGASYTVRDMTRVTVQKDPQQADKLHITLDES